LHTGRGRGRQAEARRNDDAVQDAARAVFAIHGPDAPVSAVAAAAGVGMGTLYRRYASKDVLLQHLCQASMDQQIDAARIELDRRGEPWEALSGFIKACVSFRSGALRNDVTSTDIHRLIELFSWWPDEFASHERLLTVALDGLRTPALSMLPGPPPTWASYAERWGMNE
jgi:AcrR family transcriptional regulator